MDQFKSEPCGSAPLGKPHGSFYNFSIKGESQVEIQIQLAKTGEGNEYFEPILFDFGNVDLDK